MPHSNWPCALLFDLAHKHCSGIKNTIWFPYESRDVSIFSAIDILILNFNFKFWNI